MEVQYLLKDELVHEVGVRGYRATKKDTKSSLVKVYNQLCSQEGQWRDALLPLDAEDELLKIGLKLNDISLSMSHVEGGVQKPERTRALLSHLNKRLSRLWSLAEPQFRDEIKTCVSLLKGYVAEFRAMGEESVYAATSVFSVTSHTKSHRSRSRSRSTSNDRETKGPKSQSKSFEGKPPDFHKWGIKFSGAEGTSVLSFIVAVEEKATWKGIDLNTLVLGASEFFVEDSRAKTWFRGVKSTIDSWEELKIALRNEFLPLDYFENLWEEIRSRKQGKRELMGEYVANMIALFERMEMLEPVKDEVKLAILKKNLAPFYLSRLALTAILSIDQLKKLGKELEVSRARIESYDGTNKSKLVEPEFAVKNASPRKTYKVSAVATPSCSHGDSVANPENSGSCPDSTEVNAFSPSKIKCWNCQELGHRFTDCPVKEKKLFCHGCGRGGITSLNCPKCQSRRKSKDQGKESSGASRV